MIKLMAKQKVQNDLKNLLLDTLAEFYQDFLKKEMASKKDLQGLASKKDLEKFATKKDLQRFATKKDLEKLALRLERFATKKDLEELASRLERFATKNDLEELKVSLLEEIRGNNRLITNIEVELLNMLKNHEARIGTLEKIHPQLTV